MKFNKLLLLMVLMLFTVVLVACEETSPNPFIVTFEPNNGQASFTSEYEAGQLILEPANPTKENYDFDAWYKDIGFNERWDFNTHKVTSDMTLYAKWHEKAPAFYTISFDSQGGSEFLPINSGPNGNLLDFTGSVPTRDGYEFKGWYKDADTTLPVLETDIITSNVTLYAKWDKIIYYFEVSFESNGGSPLDDLILAENELIEEPAITRVGNYEFDGWYKESDFINKWNFEQDKVTSDIKLYAKWLNVFTVTFNTQGGLSIPNQMIADGKLVTKPDNPVRDGFNFVGWSTSPDIYEVYDFTKPITKLTTIYAIWELGEAIEINTNEAFLKLIENPDGGNYKLTKDLDFYGQKIEVPSHTRTFSGILDGNGYSIKNIDASSASNKQGVFFKVLEGTVKNLVIENSTFKGGGEATGFITAHIHGGAVVDNIEFINVTVTNTGNYTALIAGDDANNAKPNKPITISNIIVRNYADSIIRGNEHTAGLIGYLRVSNVTLNVSNVYFEGNIQSTGATAAFILGRLGASPIHVNVSNVVMKGNLTATKQVGSIVGQGISGTNIQINKAYFSNTKFTTSETTNNAFVGNGQGSIVLSDAYYALEQTEFYRDYEGGSQLLPNQGVSKLNHEITLSWFESLSLDDLFKYEDNDIVLNKEIIKAPIGIIFDVSEMKPFYIVGDLFDIDKLKVKLLYTNGQSDVISLDDPDLTIDITTLDMQEQGIYEIHVTYQEFERSLIINVVEIESIYIYETDFISLYIKKQTLNTNDLHIFAKLSDDSTIRLEKTNLELITDYDASVPGNYELSYKYLTFETQNIPITVIDEILLAIDNKVVVEVDKGLEYSSINASNPKYKTIKEALLVLEKSNLGQAEKVISIKNGSYYEKITINLPNVIMVGQSQTETIIYYDQAAGFEKPEGGTWGTQGSATVSVKASASNFMMANLTVKNTFDYFGTNISASQGVALVNEADKAIYYKVSFYGVQDTLYAKSGRQWYYDTYIEGAVDYIFGNGGPVFIEKSTIHSLYRSNSDAVITAYKGFNGTSASDGLPTYGVLFYQNTLTSEAGTPERKVYFGRPWAQEAIVSFIDNKIMFNNLDSNHWTSMSGNTPEKASFFEFENKNSENQLIPYAANSAAKVLTSTEKDDWINKDLFFSTTNGELTFNGIFTYEQNMQYLMSLVTQ